MTAIARILREHLIWTGSIEEWTSVSPARPSLHWTLLDILSPAIPPLSTLIIDGRPSSRRRRRFASLLLQKESTCINSQIGIWVVVHC